MKQHRRFGLMGCALSCAASFLAACNNSPQNSSVPAPPTPSAETSSTAPIPTPAVASTSDDDAIRQAIEDHVRNNKGINLAAMNMSVDSIHVNGNQAQANATFQLKQGGTSMVMTYALTRHANSWLVMTSQPSDGDFVHPPMDKLHSSATATTSAAPAATGAANGPSMPDFSDYMKSHAANPQK
jgi:hypothetical protein